MISLDAVKTISLKQQMYYKDIEQLNAIQKNVISELMFILNENKQHLPNEEQQKLDTLVALSQFLLNPFSKKEDTEKKELSDETNKTENKVIPFRKKPNFKIV